MTENAQSKRPVEVVDRPTSVEVFHVLSAALPTEALSTDDSRGFPLTSIKAGFILERLNETFGLLGYGWRYAVGPHWREVGDKGEEILVEVALQWRVSDGKEQDYCPPLYWLRSVHPETGAISEGWGFSEKSLVYCWSEPVFAKGGSHTRRKGSTPLNDAHRSAVTNAITKAAARLGVGLEVYKGQDELSQDAPNGPAKGEKRRQSGSRRQSGDPPRPTRAPKAATALGSLEAIQEAARAQADRLTFEGSGDPPQAKTQHQLAQQMEAMGIQMQAVKLVHILLGPGNFTQKGVMGVHNLLLKGLVEGDVTLLNQAV